MRFVTITTIGTTPSRSPLHACWLTRSLASAVKLARSLATWISTSSHSTCETPSCQAEPKGRLLLGSPIGTDANKNNIESRPQQTMKKLMNERSILFTKIWLTIAFNKLKTLTIHTSLLSSISFLYILLFLSFHWQSLDHMPHSCLSVRHCSYRLSVVTLRSPVVASYARLSCIFSLTFLLIFIPLHPSLSSIWNLSCSLCVR